MERSSWMKQWECQWRWYTGVHIKNWVVRCLDGNCTLYAHYIRVESCYFTSKHPEMQQLTCFEIAHYAVAKGLHIGVKDIEWQWMWGVLSSCRKLSLYYLLMILTYLVGVLAPPGQRTSLWNTRTRPHISGQRPYKPPKVMCRFYLV